MFNINEYENYKNKADMKVGSFIGSTCMSQRAEEFNYFYVTVTVMMEVFILVTVTERVLLYVHKWITLVQWLVSGN